jgi:hypothetical protein
MHLEAIHNTETKKYPLASHPGIRSKYGKRTNAWNIVYDPTMEEDKVII